MSYNELRKGRYSEVGQEYFITTVVMQRQHLFSNLSCARSFVRQLQFTEQQGLVTWLAWVLMPDHFHALLRLNEGNLSTVMKYVNGRSAREINKIRQRIGPVWQPGYYDRALRDEEDRLQIARYIVANPLRAGLVQRVGDYPHWDSRWL